ncbi:unnamed protein product, partial [Candidula unifasciata]
TECSSEQDSVLAYVQLSKEESEQMLLMNVHEIQSKLRDKFCLDSETSLKDAAVLDYYVGATHWGQQQGYSVQQLSVLFTMVHTLLNKIKEEQVPLVDLISEFHNMIAMTCRDTTTENIFSIQQSKAITDFLSSSLFQHYTLYQFLFSTPQDEEIITKDFFVEVPVPYGVPFPKSLDEGLPEEIFTTISALESLQLETATESQEDTDTSETKCETPIEVELPPDANNIFEKLTPEDVKAVITETCAVILNNLEKDVEKKITQQKATALTKLNMIQNIPPLSGKSSDSK